MDDQSKKKIDQAWKDSVKREKEKNRQSGSQVPPQEMNFNLFISSLGMQALMHLGEIANPLTKKKEKDLAQAKQTIDLISILKDKTRGNLDEAELGLLDNLLYELQMKYLKTLK
jgi:hypothetical protein